MNKLITKKSFTLIEMLIVISIVGVLVGVASASYLQLTKQSRDARRKADLEQIRAALEMYRSDNSYYLPGTLLNSLSPTYMNSIPLDPSISKGYSYQYEARPVGCAGSNCSDYIMAAKFEAETSTCTDHPVANCKGGTVPAACDYCLNAYGKKN